MLVYLFLLLVSQFEDFLVLLVLEYAGLIAIDFILELHAQLSRPVGQLGVAVEYFGNLEFLLDVVELWPLLPLLGVGHECEHLVLELSHSLSRSATQRERIFIEVFRGKLCRLQGECQDSIEKAHTLTAAIGRQRRPRKEAGRP